ncbi:MAG TPA: 23S rRNA (uracil(1939)-C(5))-methyltransferase RlmD [Herpetosiphonaceae bacterium]|nr:23S rRNA (uracil(1939)-C(5))-methyltransferase RlmD [Herpetosiphonaceae bacterium]
MTAKPSTTWPASVDVAIESLAQGGAGVGRVDGRPVFVEGALPTELVRATLNERRDGWARGSVIDLLGPAAPERIMPPCPVFGTCGGCDWQYHHIESQRAGKAAILAEQIRHVGRQEGVAVAPTAGGEPWAYRSVATFHVAEGKIGFYAAGGREVVDLEACPLLEPRLNAALDGLRELLPLAGLRDVTLRLSTATGAIHAHLEGWPDATWRTWARNWQAEDPAISGISSATRNGWLMLVGSPYIEERVGDLRLRISPTSFFQANVERARAVLADLESRLDLTPQSRLLDAYCGVGTFVLPLAGRVAQAWGIEEHPHAIADARWSARQHGIANANLLPGKVEEVLPTIKGQLDAVILDPPRRGVEPAAIKALLRQRPAQIAYVSCHPGTLARDVRLLVDGGYAIRSAQPFDFFPQSSHIESLVILALA